MPKKEPHFPLPSIVEALQFRMEQYGWQAYRLAKEIGMNKGHFSEVMSGKRRLPLNARIKAHRLGIPANVLLQ
jgi:antitoxin component HigA of HigAB toxin-antitoxin module